MNIRKAELRLQPIAHRVLVIDMKTRRWNGQILSGMLRLDLPSVDRRAIGTARAKIA